MINFIERIKSYSKRKDTADMAIRAWKSANEEAYANFCKRIDAVAKGNISVMMDMYLMMRDCVPPEALMMYNWLSDFVNGKDVSDIANQQWAGQYTKTIARCITNKCLWIGINVKTGTVELFPSPKSGLLMVHSAAGGEVLLDWAIRYVHEKQQRMLSVEQTGKKNGLSVPDLYLSNYFPLLCGVHWWVHG